MGGLEIATTAAGMAALEGRAAAAHQADLPARVLSPREAVARAPRLVNPAGCVGGVRYTMDGTARADVATAALRDRATASGARFHYDSGVTGVTTANGAVRGVRVGDHHIPADDVVLACGIWGPQVAAMAGERLDLTAVAHPYVYGPPGAVHPPTPFVRWPERHVCARDHGGRLGMGSYDHRPLEVTQDRLGGTADQTWRGDVFDPAVAAAMDLLPGESRFVPHERLNGLFAMTADNLPLVGAMRTAGLWAAAALWVTQAAGAARLLADLMNGREPQIAGAAALDPQRFSDQDSSDLTRRALHLYRDIYAPA